MNVLSLYLLLGIGVDDLYVMTDAFRQARDYLLDFVHPVDAILRLLLIKCIGDFTHNFRRNRASRMKMALVFL